jgi:hypothetical protein
MPRLALAMLVGCAALTTGCSHLKQVTPDGFNMTGTWVTQQPAEAPPPQSVFDPNAPIETGPPGEHEGDGAETPIFRGPIPRLPMLTTTRMTIDQDATSMGIAYPRQPYRDVKWGEQKRPLYTVDAGWDDDHRLIIKTSNKAMRVTEIYSLAADGKTLTLDVELSSRRGTRHIVRTFTRAE